MRFEIAPRVEMFDAVQIFARVDVKLRGSECPEARLGPLIVTCPGGCCRGRSGSLNQSLEFYRKNKGSCLNLVSLLHLYPGDTSAIDESTIIRLLIYDEVLARI